MFRKEKDLYLRTTLQSACQKRTKSGDEAIRSLSPQFPAVCSGISCRTEYSRKAAGGANRSTHWCESLHPDPPERGLVWAARTEQQATNLRTHADQVQHSRRPTSAPMLNR